MTENEFDHWLAIFATAQASVPGGPARTPDPPLFERCVRALARQPTLEGSQKRSQRQLERVCRRHYRRLKRQTMEFLIQARWIEQHAKALGIQIDDDELRDRFERELGDTFQDDDELERVLATSGRTKDDALFQLRLTELQARLMRELKRRVVVTDEEIEAYYRENRGRFDKPLDQVQERVRAVLRARREERALAGFTDGIARRYRDQTNCAPGFVVRQCGSVR